MKKYIITMVGIGILVILLVCFYVSMYPWEQKSTSIPGETASYTYMDYMEFFKRYSNSVFEADTMEVNVLTNSSGKSEMICKKDGITRKFEIKFDKVCEDGNIQMSLQSDEGKTEAVYYGRIVDERCTECTMELSEDYENDLFFGKLKKISLKKIIDNPIRAVQEYFEKTFGENYGNDGGYYELDELYYDVMEKNGTSERIQVVGVLVHYDKSGKTDGEQKEYKKIFDVRYEEDKYEIYDENGEFIYLTYMEE